MYEEKILAAKKSMKKAAIFKLAWIALMALWIASSYNDNHENLIRIAMNRSSLPVLLAGALLSAAVSIFWTAHPLVPVLHLLVYIPAGVIYYSLLPIDLLNLHGISALAGFLVFCPLLFICGIIPFFMYNSANKKLKKAKQMQAMEEMQTEESIS